MSETSVSGPGLDIKALEAAGNHRGRGLHGWFAGGTRSFDWLLKRQEVCDWIDNYTAPATRNHKLYQFAKVLAASGRKDPADLLKLTDQEAKTLIKRVAQFYLQKGKPSPARQIVITMRGFYEAHGRKIEFMRSEKIRTAPLKKIAIQYVPTRVDIYRMADAALSLRNKAIMLCLFQSGVRVGCLCKWTYGMVADQLYQEKEIQLPVEIKVTQDMDSKLAGYGLGYYVTFLAEEAAQALKDYINERKRNGWNPKASDPIFVTESSASQDRPMVPVGVWEIVKSTAVLAGLERAEGVWTHTLRKSFRKVLNDTPPIPEDMKEALMGHKLPGSRGSYFDVHDVEDAAEKYMQANWSRNGGNNHVKALKEELNDLRKKLAGVDSIKADIALLKAELALKKR